jgi:hypothetical protein
MLYAASVEGGDCVSMTPPSEASGSSLANSHYKRKRCVFTTTTLFRAWQFHFMIKTDLRDGTTSVEKEKLLTEHLRARTGHTRPLCIIGVVVFCDRSLFSQPPDGDGLVSIAVIGYVQTKAPHQFPKMKKWIDSATWKPVEGGLTSDNEYMSNMRGFEDPND